MGIGAQREPRLEGMRYGGWWHKILDEAFFYMLQSLPADPGTEVLEEEMCDGRRVR